MESETSDMQDEQITRVSVASYASVFFVFVFQLQLVS